MGKQKTVADYPNLVQEWHPTKNNGSLPNDFTSGSSQKVWWKCNKGPDHEWLARVKHRTGINKKNQKGSGCSFCRPPSGRSKPRVSITTSLRPKYRKEWHPVKNMGLDIMHFHSASTKEVWWKCPKNPDHEWKAVIRDRTGCKSINIRQTKPDIQGNGCGFCSGYRTSINNSLALINPKLSKEWHPIKNGKISPRTVVAGSKDPAWWKCSNSPDHIWHAIIDNRNRSDNLCPFCRHPSHKKQKAKPSIIYSLAVNCVELSKEWHPTKNKKHPYEITPGSQDKVWWKCKNGPDHEWEMAVYERKNGGACLFCHRNQKVSITNSLASLNPQLSKELHPIQKPGVSPYSVKLNDRTQKLRWQCRVDSEHNWQATISSKLHRDSECDDCKILGNKYPELCRQWHPTKNLNSPYDYTAGSDEKVWWKCPEGPDHVWQADIYSRAERKGGCPYCRGREFSITNTLQAVAPGLAKELNSVQVYKFTPRTIRLNDKTLKVSWVCSKNPEHTFKSYVKTRYKNWRNKEHDCPICNSLELKYPDIAKQWHPIKNATLTPSGVSYGKSDAKFWWKCIKHPSHQWRATVKNRTINRSGCPNCDIRGSSKEEIRLAFELGYHFRINHYRKIIKTKEWRWHVDIIALDYNLLIEYDGSFYHKNNLERDIRKAESLRNAGYRVIRVREFPLEKTSDWDVVIPHNSAANEAALIVLEHIENKLGIQVSKMKDRRDANGPLCDTEAQAYIDKLIEKQLLENRRKPKSK